MMSKSINPIKLSLVDRFVSSFNPEAGLRRAQAKLAMSYLDSTGYIVPGGSRRAVKAWTPSSNNADGDTIPKVGYSRAGCRDLVMNTPMARAALKRELTNVVGWGLNLQCRIDRASLGLSDKEATDWERKTEREFRLWANSVDCDAERESTFYELQGIALYNTSLSGDTFTLLPFIPRKDMPYDLRVKILEADICSNPNGQVDTTTIAGGIEVDSDGAPIKYYFRFVEKNTPIATAYRGVGTWKPIDAYGKQSNRRNVIHLKHKERPGQRRGMPMLAPVVEILKQMSRLTEAELMASVVSSFFTVFVKTSPAQGGLSNGFIPEESIPSAQPDATNQNTYAMGSGSVIELPEDGQSIEIADPKRPNAAFEPFFSAMVKQLGAAIEIPFEQLMLHFDASYSAARGAILEAWKFYRQRRIWLSRNFCQPIYEAWLTEAILKGHIIAQGFFNDPSVKSAYVNAAWSGPGQGQIDPMKESQAAFYRVDKMLSTYEDEWSAIHGTDWEGGIDRIVRERAMIDERGLKMPVPDGTQQIQPREPDQQKQKGKVEDDE